MPVYQDIVRGNEPTLLVEIAFDEDPYVTDLTSVTWYDVTRHVRSVSTRASGRNFQTDSMQAGVANIVLDNREYDYDPTYTGSPYYDTANSKTKLRAGKLVRIAIEWGGGTSYLFTGFTGNFKMSFPGSGRDSICQVPCLDATVMFARRSFSSTDKFLSEQLTSDRYVAVLDAIGWPGTGLKVSAGWRNISGGYSTCGIENEGDLDGTNVLSYLKDIEKTEQGTGYIAPNGEWTFHYRRYRVDNSTVPVATFGGVGGLPHRGFSIDNSNERVFNRISARRKFSPLDILVTDSTSITENSELELQISGLLQPDDNDGYNDARSVASSMLRKYKDPVPEIRKLSAHFIPGNSDMTSALLTTSVGDRIRVIRRRHDGSEIDLDFYVEGIEHNIGSDISSWSSSFVLSGVRGAVTGWLVSNASTGEFAENAWVGQNVVGF